jgi:PIN domain nuclease of toxin-antitoxin system
VKLLLDTHVLLWAAANSPRLPAAIRILLDDPATELLFSAASLWEIAIKRGLGRDDFRVDPRLLRRRTMDHGYAELPITGAHAIGIEALPPIHKDPFDRILISQAATEGIVLLTADPVLAQYPAPVRVI